jgi:hypothetical protein
MVWAVTTSAEQPGAGRRLLAPVGLAAATLATWWLWLGTIKRYEVDPVTGATTGPYQPWQVVGCVLTLLVIAVVGGLLTRPWLVVIAMTVPFTVAWSVDAAAHDDSGLWPVGAVLVLAGMAIGTALCGYGARLVRTTIGRRR